MKFGKRTSPMSGSRLLFASNDLSIWEINPRTTPVRFLRAAYGGSAFDQRIGATITRYCRPDCSILRKAKLLL